MQPCRAALTPKTSHGTSLNLEPSGGCRLLWLVMSFALWPVFEDGQEHSLGDEGAPVFRAYEKLDAIAVAGGHTPLEAFDAHAGVPAAVVARLAGQAQDLPDLSGFPVAWHDPADAVAAIDVILSALAAPDLEWDGEEDPGELADCLTAIRQALQHAVTRQTRFHFMIA
jgi:hypothetical protein